MPFRDLHAVLKFDRLNAILSLINVWYSMLKFCFCFQPLERVGRSIMKEKEVPDDLLVISCEEDYQTCAPLLERGQNYLHHALYTILSGNLGSQLTYTSTK